MHNYFWVWKALGAPPPPSSLPLPTPTPNAKSLKSSQFDHQHSSCFQAKQWQWSGCSLWPAKCIMLAMHKSCYVAPMGLFLLCFIWLVYQHLSWWARFSAKSHWLHLYDHDADTAYCTRPLFVTWRLGRFPGNLNKVDDAFQCTCSYGTAFRQTDPIVRQNKAWLCKHRSAR